MEPMRPEFRQALKEAHPGLTDDIIDEYEKLTALRYRLDQQRFRASVDEVDRKRDELLRARMPFFSQVAQAMVAQRKAERPSESGFKVEFKPERPTEKGST